jgi:hypothetical protein
MKEKIEQLAKGIYEYELPDILVSDDIIEVSLQEDTVFHGSVTFKAGDNRTVKGVVYSSNQTFHIIQETFIGVDNVIEYEVSSKRLQTGESIEGEITIVSNVGEKIIPFCIKVESRYFDTSIGKIRDL